eukprot:RCo011278
MSGAGRSHRAKHLVQSCERQRKQWGKACAPPSGPPAPQGEPGASESVAPEACNDEQHWLDSIVQVVSCRSSALYEIRTQSGTTAVARLPRKFEKVVWIKRGDYVVLEGLPQFSEASSGGASCTIQEKLFPDTVKQLRRKGLWPAVFDQAGSAPGPVASSGPSDPAERAEGESGSDDEEGKGCPDDPFSQGNPNRRAPVCLDGDSDGED